MNLVLLPIYGILGAAIATLVSCLVVTVLNALLSYKYILIRIDIKTIIYYLVFSILTVLVVKQIQTSAVWINLIAKIIAGTVIIVPVVMIREKEIFAYMRKILIKI